MIATKKTNESIDEHIRPDGTTAYKLRCFFPYTEQGELKLVIGYGIDVTELKTAQKTVLELFEKERGLSDLKPNSSKWHRMNLEHPWLQFKQAWIF